VIFQRKINFFLTSHKQEQCEDIEYIFIHCCQNFKL
jgi:hypothetical protein